MSDVWYCINESDTGDWVTSIWDGLGIPAAQIPSTGESGAAYLFNDIAGQGASPTDEFSSTILTVPPVGVFTHDEYSALSFTGAGDGVYTATYSAELNGVPYLNPGTGGEWVITMTIGNAQPQLTGTSPFPKFTASGELDVTAQPAMLTGNSRMPKFSASAAMTVHPGEMQISCAASLPSLSMTGTLVVYYSQATGDPLIMKQRLVNERRSIEERNNQPN